MQLLAAKKAELDDNDKLGENNSLEDTSSCNQLKVLLRRGFIKAKRDSVSHREIFIKDNATICFTASDTYIPKDRGQCDHRPDAWNAILEMWFSGR